MTSRTISVDTQIFNEIFSYLEPKDICSFLSAMHLNGPTTTDNNNHLFSKKELFSLFYSDKNNNFTPTVDFYISSRVSDMIKLCDHDFGIDNFAKSFIFNICRDFFPLLDNLEIKVFNVIGDRFYTTLFKIVKFVVSMELFNTPITLESFAEISDLCDSYGMMRPKSERKTVIAVLTLFENFRNESQRAFNDSLDLKTLNSREKIFKQIYNACLRQLQLFERDNDNRNHLDIINILSLSSNFKTRYPTLKNCLFEYFYANNFLSSARINGFFDSLLTTANTTIFAIDLLRFMIDIREAPATINCLFKQYDPMIIQEYSFDPIVECSLIQSFNVIIQYIHTRCASPPLSILDSIIAIINNPSKVEKYYSIIDNILSIFPFDNHVDISDSFLMARYYIDFYCYTMELDKIRKFKINRKFFEFYFNLICTLFSSHNRCNGFVTGSKYESLVKICIDILEFAARVEDKNHSLDAIIKAMSNTALTIDRRVFEHLSNVQLPLLKFNSYKKFAKFLRLRNVDYVSVSEYKVVDFGEIDESIISYFIDKERQFLPILSFALINDDCHYSLGIMLCSLFKICANDQTINSIIDKIIEMLISSTSVDCIIAEYPFIKNKLFRRFSCHTLKQLSEKMKYCEKYSFFATIISPNILASLSSNSMKLFNIKQIEKIINYLALGSTTPSSHDKMLIKHFLRKNDNDITNLKIAAVRQKRNDILEFLINLESK